MEHGSSKTEKLIYRTSYLKHKQRLLDIRPHIDKPTTQQHARAIRTRQAGSLRQGDRQVQQLYSTEQMRQQGKRYEQGEEYKFEIKSDFNDGEPLRCVLPVGKLRANSFGSGQKNSAQQITKRNSLTNKFKSYGRSDKKFESFNVPRETERSPPPPPQPEAYFNLPERNQNRQVIHKKTIILSPTQSAMLQLSLIGERLLIVAYLMGAENFTIKELLSLKRSKEKLEDYAENFEELCCRITIERIAGKYASLKIRENDEVNKEKVQNTVSEDRAKLKAKVQNEFIKRNYYTLLKNEEENEAVKEKPSVSKEKVQAIVDRLAVPRKYSKPSEENIPLPPKPMKNLPPPVPYKKPFKSPAYPIYNQMNQIPQLPEPLKPQLKANKTEQDIIPIKKTQPKKTEEGQQILPAHSKTSLGKSKSLAESIHPKSEIPHEKQFRQQEAVDLIDLPLLPRQPADFNEFDESDKPEEPDEEEKFKQEEEQYEEEQQFEPEGDSEDIERHQQENRQQEKYKLDDDEVEYLGQEYDEEFENPSTIKKSDLPNSKPVKTQLQPVKQSGLYENSFEEDYQQDEFEASKPVVPKAPQEDYAQSFQN